MNFDHDFDMRDAEPLGTTWDEQLGVQVGAWSEAGAMHLRWHDPHDARRFLAKWLADVDAVCAQESLALHVKPTPDGNALRLAQTPPVAPNGWHLSADGARFEVDQ